MEFKNLLLILSISSSLLISSNAVPSYQIFKLHDFLPVSAPAKAPESSASAPVKAPESSASGISVSSLVSGATSGISVNSLVSGTTKAANKVIDPEIVQFCVDTQNPTLCAETISEVLSTAPFDPIKAVEIEVDETLKQAATVAETITKLQNDPSTDKKLMDALDICTSQYGDMVDAIKEATELMQQQNVVDAYYKFNAVISFKASCDDAFLETPGVNHVPFEAEEIPLYDLSGNVLAMMNGIVNGYRM